MKALNLLTLSSAILAVITPAIGARAACTGSSPTWTSTPDFASVSSCVSSASAGDTINVSSGSATWSSSLNIRKGINLIGAGIGKTVIKRGGSEILSYFPSNYGLNSPFRLSGFSFNGAGGQIMYLGEDGKKAPYVVQTKIRIDNNRFYSSTSVNDNYQALTYRGAMYGVVDNNTFDTYAYPMRNTNTAYGSDWWDSYATTGFAYNYGDKYNLYFEDNTFNLGTNSDWNTATNCQFSGRYLFRYNTITMSRNAYPLFDLHGNQGGDMYSCFGAEIYGNLVVPNGYGHYVQMRDGKTMIFFNSNLGGVSYNNEYNDARNPTANPQPGHISDSYWFVNRRDLTGSDEGADFDQTCYDGSCYVPTANRDYWLDTAPFDGTSGVGCGSVASRPSSCTQGVAYWATNQSCTDLTGKVGVNPSTPIRGTLYKCTSQNTWTAYYTPYEYPHPLRKGEGDPLTLVAPTELQVVQ